MKKLIISMLLATSMSSAYACSDLSKWSSHDGAISVAEIGVTANATRLEGLCSLEAKKDGGFVTASFNNATTDTYVRFYVLNRNADTSNVEVVKLSDGSSTVSGYVNNGAFTFGNGSPIELSGNNWHLIQLRITPAGSEVWVDDFEGTPTSVSMGLTNAPTSLQLGTLSGTADNSVYFDSVIVKSAESIGNESVSLANEGPIIPGDGNGDASSTLTLADLVAIVKEARGGIDFSNGVPDANLDGEVTLADVIKVLKIVRGN